MGTGLETHVRPLDRRLGYQDVFGKKVKLGQFLAATAVQDPEEVLEWEGNEKSDWFTSCVGKSPVAVAVFNNFKLGSSGGIRVKISIWQVSGLVW